MKHVQRWYRMNWALAAWMAMGKRKMLKEWRSHSEKYTNRWLRCVCLSIWAHYHFSTHWIHNELKNVAKIKIVSVDEKRRQTDRVLLFFLLDIFMVCHFITQHKFSPLRRVNRSPEHRNRRKWIQIVNDFVHAHHTHTHTMSCVIKIREIGWQWETTTIQSTAFERCE